LPNRLTFSGNLIERDSLRLTPAGIPVITGRLRHVGEAVEAGVTRQLDFEIDIMGIGDIAKQLQRCALGDRLDIVGFIAPKSKRSSRWVLHIQTLTIEET
jgi:primosomal replication protein N